jgi:hypothetical protein
MLAYFSHEEKKQEKKKNAVNSLSFYTSDDAAVRISPKQCVIRFPYYYE